jgi:hypothetical protein
LQQSGSPRLQIFRRCRAREGGDGGERRRQ